MVYNLNESLGYSRGAATNKTAPQTTKITINYTIKRVIFRPKNTTSSLVLIITFIINSIIELIIIIINTNYSTFDSFRLLV